MNPTTPQETPRPPIGQTIEGRYHVTRLIDDGGMATVYEATDTRLTRRVALKVMHTQLAQGPGRERFVRHFISEATSAARIANPHIVQVYDFGEWEGLDFLVMEYVAGTNLRREIARRGRFTIGEAMRVIGETLDGLAAAHTEGVVHRDIKPENILLDHRGHVRITDFGLAKAASSATMATTGTLLGTAAYLAPEMIEKNKALPQGDLYSTGVMAWELVCGIVPFDCDNPMTMVYRHVHNDVPDLKAIYPGIPAAFSDFVTHLTRRDPDLRPADANAALGEHAAALAALSEADLEWKADHAPSPQEALSARPAAASEAEDADGGDADDAAKTAGEATGAAGQDREAAGEAAEEPGGGDRPTPLSAAAIDPLTGSVTSITEATQATNTTGNATGEEGGEAKAVRPSGDWPLLTGSLFASDPTPWRQETGGATGDGKDGKEPDAIPRNTPEGAPGDTGGIRRNESGDIPVNSLRNESGDNAAKAPGAGGITGNGAEPQSKGGAGKAAAQTPEAGRGMPEAPRRARTVAGSPATTRLDTRGAAPTTPMSTATRPTRAATPNRGGAPAAARRSGQQLVPVDAQHATQNTQGVRIDTHRRGHPVIAGLITLLIVAIIGVAWGLWWLFSGPGSYVELPAAQDVECADAAACTVAGADWAQYQATLDSLGVEYQVTEKNDDEIESNHIISTSPSTVGTHISKRGGIVSVTISSGPLMHTIPADITDPTSEDGSNPLAALAQAGFDNVIHSDADDQYSITVPRGAVISITPSPGSTAAHNAAITVILSKGPKPVTMPALEGLSRQEAQDALDGLQLDVTWEEDYSDSVAEGTVISASAQDGATLHWGDSVTVTVSLGPQMATVPNVVGKTYDEAASQLEALGFQVERKTTILGNWTDQVRAQSIEDGQSVRIRDENGNPTVITLTVV